MTVFRKKRLFIIAFFIEMGYIIDSFY